VRLILLSAAALLLASCSAGAAVYYVDSGAGADFRTGLSPEAAWRSLSRVRTANLAPGDSLLLKRGSVWSDRLTIASSGTPEAPIRIGAYGWGDRPVLDGSRLANGTTLLTVSQASFITISDLELRNSRDNGLSANGCNSISVTGVVVSRSQRNGMLFYDCNNLLIEDCDIFANAQDTSDSFDGIRIDGSGTNDLTGFRIRHSTIHDNIGGLGWRGANGIFIGHTGGMPPVLGAVEISGNDVYANGNPQQNQAGRGITGTFDGDVEVSLNKIHHNASAGLYFGDHGTRAEIAILHNFFHNNSLRQFGGFTDASARVVGNMILVDDPALTAMGGEMGGNGTWTLLNNTFTYTTPTDDQFRGFIRINDASLDTRLDSDYNVFYSAGPQRWKLSDGLALDFAHWQLAGHDTHSRSLR
jgi:Right handed beta helix region